MFDQLLATVTSRTYLGQVTALDLAELRARRSECQHVEETLSYLRRVVQGELDIVVGELERRRSGGDRDDLSDLVARLPQLLSSRVATGTGGRFTNPSAPDDDTGSLGHELNVLMSTHDLNELPERSDDQLRIAAAELGGFEAKLSTVRRQLHDRIDEMQAELVRRYRTGEATVDKLLHD